jgi:hypothetical protein
MIRAFIASWAARKLAQHRCSSERERIKERARQIRAELKLPPLKALAR